MSRTTVPTYEQRERTYAMEYCPDCGTSHVAYPDHDGGRTTDCPNQ